MRTKNVKVDTAITDKRPLRLACAGGPYKFLTVWERTPRSWVEVPDETGHRTVGVYKLKDAVYVWHAGT